MNSTDALPIETELVPEPVVSYRPSLDVAICTAHPTGYAMAMDCMGNYIVASEVHDLPTIPEAILAPVGCDYGPTLWAELHDRVGGILHAMSNMQDGATKWQWVTHTCLLRHQLDVLEAIGGKGQHLAHANILRNAREMWTVRCSNAEPRYGKTAICRRTGAGIFAPHPSGVNVMVLRVDEVTRSESPLVWEFGVREVVEFLRRHGAPEAYYQPPTN